MSATLALHNELIEARETLKTAREARDKADAALKAASDRRSLAGRAEFIAAESVDRYVAAMEALGVEVPPEETR